MSTWEPMLESILGRLGLWRNKYISLGGRIVLIKAVLNAIPIFYLSYIKMPVKVWRELVKIQRQFLWGGLSNQSKTCWVKWDDVCRPKKEAGLGIRDLRLVSKSLLAKWRWKFLSIDNEVLKDIVNIARYSDDVIGKRFLWDVDSPRLASSWWRDLYHLMVTPVGLARQWVRRWEETIWFIWLINRFSSAVGKNVGRGDLTYLTN
jgi:hypothetical protein